MLYSQLEILFHFQYLFTLTEFLGLSHAEIDVLLTLGGIVVAWVTSSLFAPVFHCTTGWTFCFPSDSVLCPSLVHSS